MRIGTRIIGLVAFLAISTAVLAQPNTEPDDLKKPKGMEEHLLGSEKSANKKFTRSRHFFQNLYTHYNYFYNANLILNNIIDQAKTQNKDDYTKLLSFYNYSLDNTAKSKDIDSVINKSTAGILLHDLRNDWVDNLYILIGRAYLLRKNYDTASSVFQYVNYAFAPTDKDGYKKVIGSNSEGGSTLSIATKDNKNVVKKIFERQPSRDESFIWQIRTLTEMELYIDAASLITTLKGDPIFPKRLFRQLAEDEAYNYYKQQQYDSSAKYLAQAVTLAEGNTEKARWYYLIGQMYQATNQPTLAADFFTKCVNTTVDPIMEVYARLAELRLKKENDPNAIASNIEEMLKLAKKERFYSNRDIIFYAAALSEMERKGYDNAENYLHKSIKYNEGDQIQRSKSFMLLGDIAYIQKKYGKASLSYDSVQERALDSATALTLKARRPGCHTIYVQDRIIFVQDSLQKIAAMPEADRRLFVKNLSKKLRKAQGLKEEEESLNSGLAANPNALGKGPSDLFASSSSGSSGSYFDNPTMRANGFRQFKQLWGNRPNVDNWRRSDVLQQAPVLAQQAQTDNDTSGPGKKMLRGGLKLVGLTGDSSATTGKTFKEGDVSYEALMAKVPITRANLKASNNIINLAMFEEGKALENQLEDYPEAIKVYEALLERLKNEVPTEEVLFNLAYCYSKIGDLAKEADVRQRLNSDFKNGVFTKKMNTPIISPEKKDPAATAKYKDIYNMFIEGDFARAEQEKLKADSIYKDNYWTPQLLYIEAVYYIKEHKDAIALQQLNHIVNSFPKSLLAPKAKLMIEVLGHRKELEDYLTKLNIKRAKDEDSTTTIPTITPAKPKPVEEPIVRNDSLNLKKAAHSNVASLKTDTAAGKPIAINNKKIQAKTGLTSTYLAPPKKDTVVNAPLVKAAAPKKDSAIITVKKPSATTNGKADSVHKPNVPPPIAVIPKDTGSKKTTLLNNPFVFNPDEPQMAAVLLNKVDIVYINECKNAFDRYNQVNIHSQHFELQKIKLNADHSLITINAAEFTNASKTMDYVKNIKPRAATQIVPWLDADKFTVIMISQSNLNLLMQNMDVQSYLNILKAAGY